MMNGTTEMFLAILKAAIQGQRPVIYREIAADEWHALFRLAGIHNVLPLFYEAVYMLPSACREQSLLAAVKSRVRQQVILQTMRTEEFLALDDNLQAAGVRPLVVKGIVCRALYPQPDHRPSSDEDILIPENQFETCHKVLTDFGMTAQMPVNTYEVPYRREGSPLYIELHKSLFPPRSDAYGELNNFFDQAADRAIAVDVRGHTVYTLGHTDHLFYLICHALKHFLHSGFGIRQVCDIVLYANRFGREVDWERMQAQCRAIRAEKFAAAIFRIGQNYLGFDPDQASVPPAWRELAVDGLPMLEDLLSGGLYGDASLSRKHSSNITLDAVAAQKSGKKAKSALAASVFPPAEKLEGRYPYLRKHPYLLPVAWCSRLLRYGGENRKARGGSAAEALKIGAERVELMRHYGILE